MKKIVRMVMSVMTAALAAMGSGSAREKGSEKLPKVYMFKEISSENLVKIYEALGREAAGKVAVKLSTGEPGNNNYLSPALIGDLVRRVGGTIVECNTAYGGGRSDTESHLKAAEDHGFTAIAGSGHHGCRRGSGAAGEGRQTSEGGFRRVALFRLRLYGRSVPFQGASDGRIPRRDQEYFHRHRFVGGQGVDTFRG